jgi:hypothetical protein
VNGEEFIIFADASPPPPPPDAKSVPDPSTLQTGDKRFQIGRQGVGRCEVGLEEPESIGESRLNTATMECCQVSPSERLRYARPDFCSLEIDEKDLSRSRSAPGQDIPEMQIPLGNSGIVHLAKNPGHLADQLPARLVTDAVFAKKDGFKWKNLVEGLGEEEALAAEDAVPFSEGDRPRNRKPEPSRFPKRGPFPERRGAAQERLQRSPHSGGPEVLQDHGIARAIDVDHSASRRSPHDPAFPASSG